MRCGAAWRRNPGRKSAFSPILVIPAASAAGSNRNGHQFRLFTAAA